MLRIAVLPALAAVCMARQHPPANSEDIFGARLSKCDRTKYFALRPEHRDPNPGYRTTGYFRSVFALGRCDL